jgi:YD repeat-containing protein
MRAVVLAFVFAMLTPLAFAQTSETFSYDALGRLIRATPSSGSQSCYTYDAADNRTRVVVSPVCAPAPPVANEDFVSIQISTWTWTGNLGVLLNDSDPNLPYDTLNVLSVTGSAYASVALGGTDVRFSGGPGYYPLQYTIKDSTNATSSNWIYLNVIYCNPSCIEP